MQIATQHRTYSKAIIQSNGKSTRTYREESKINVPKTDITSLINQIPKKTAGLKEITSITKPIEFAKTLQNFVKDKFPKQYNKLKYNPKCDTIINLIYNLSEIVFENNYFLEVIDEDTTLALKPISFDNYLYFVDVHELCLMPNTPLKIGYAHLLSKINSCVSNSILNRGKINSLEESHLETVIDMQEELPKGIVENHLRTINKTLRNYKKYTALNIKDFHSYNPKNKKNKELKKIINKGLQIDFSLIHRLADDQYREEAFHFGRCFQMIFDKSHFLEQQNLDYDLEYASWNSVCQPCIYYKLTQNKYDSEFGTYVSKELKTITDFLNELIIFFQE